MPLDEAIERTSKAYNHDRLHPTSADVAAQHLGYKSANNGAALQALASLRYYGLLERPSEGMLAVSKAFESYYYAPDAKLQRSMAIGWLRTPPIFSELLDKYEKGLPSDATLRHELITQRGFTPGAAETLVAVLKRSVDFVRYFEQEAASPEVSAPALEKFEAQELESPQRSTMREEVVPKQVQQSLSLEAGNEQVDNIPVRLSGGRRAWLVVPTPFYAADKARMKAQIDLLLCDDEDSQLY